MSTGTLNISERQACRRRMKNDPVEYTNSSALSIAIFPRSLRQVPLQFAIFLPVFPVFDECSLISLLHYTVYAQLQCLTRLIIVHRNRNGLRGCCRIAIYSRHTKGHRTTLLLHPYSIPYLRQSKNLLSDPDESWKK